MHPIDLHLESPAEHLEQWIKCIDRNAPFTIESKEKWIQVSTSVKEVDTYIFIVKGTVSVISYIYS